MLETPNEAVSLSVWDPLSMLRIPNTGHRWVIPSKSRSLLDLKRRRLLVIVDIDCEKTRCCCCCVDASTCVVVSSSIFEKLVLELVNLFSFRRTRNNADVQLCRLLSTLLLVDVEDFSRPSLPKSWENREPFFGAPWLLNDDFSSLYLSTWDLS